MNESITAIILLSPNHSLMIDASFVEFKYLLRRIMRLADLPTWSSTASTGCYISILSASYSRGFLIRMGRCLPPPPMVEATTSYNNVGASSSSDMLPSRTEFLRMEAAHEAAACQVRDI